LEGLHETYRQHLRKLHPEPKEFRETIATRVPTQEDRICAAHGAGGESLDRWNSDLEREEEQDQDIGAWEREWLNAHPQTESRRRIR
jgi:hypothetical protein